MCPLPPDTPALIRIKRSITPITSTPFEISRSPLAYLTGTPALSTSSSLNSMGSCPLTPHDRGTPLPMGSSPSLRKPILYASPSPLSLLTYLHPLPSSPPVPTPMLDSCLPGMLLHQRRDPAPDGPTTSIASPFVNVNLHTRPIATHSPLNPRPHSRTLGPRMTSLDLNAD